MLEALKGFEAIIKSVRVLLFEQEGPIQRLKLEISFVDGSKLLVRDYVFGGVERKYSFHCMDEDNRLRVRWANAAHWPKIQTFSHHKHVADERTVEASREVSLREVLEFIRASLEKAQEGVGRT